MTNLKRDGNYVPIQARNLTRFQELVTATRNSQFNFKPTWGVSTLRYTTTTSGTGAQVAETGGEFKLESGTTANGITSMRTNRRGQYQSGTMGQFGIGIRIPTEPTGTQFCEWGYTDFTNGFYFGYDADGVYAAYVTGGTVTKTYQIAWNIDNLEGTGVSGYTLDLTKGVITQVEFTWYGYGDIEYIIYIEDPATKEIQRISVHRFKINGSVSVVDPNQPLSFRVGNGASSTTNLALYIGGHQFSVLDGDSVPQVRAVSELATSITTALNINWQPIISFRMKANMSGRANSINVSFSNFLVAADGDLEVRITRGGTTSNLSWGAPTGVAATETGVETKVTGGTALTTSADGTPSEYAFVAASGQGVNEVGSTFVQSALALGETEEVIIWVRRLSASGAIIVKHAHVTWNEEW